MQMDCEARITLDDGSVFYGNSIGTCHSAYLELVFTTANFGYQEILTDPSYQGQGVVFTTPHVGITGVNDDDSESDKVSVGAALMRSCALQTYHPDAKCPLKDYFILHRIVAITDVDTRALVKHIRKIGTCYAKIDMIPSDEDKRNHCVINMQYKKKIDDLFLYQYHVAIIDYGVKTSILKALKERRCKITLLPPSFSYDEIQMLDIDGVVLSNGPSSPYHHSIDEVKKILYAAIPTMGICLGHQIIALALGLKVVKMHQGHRGINHPVYDQKTAKVFITAQNHGYVVVENSFVDVEVRMRSLMDHTIAGLCHNTFPIITFQGHPEGGAGPKEIEILFDEFITFLKERACQKILK